jgi:hypothetical protein
MNLMVFTDSVAKLISFEIISRIIEIGVIAIPLLALYNTLLVGTPLRDNEKREVFPAFLICMAIAAPLFMIILPIFGGNVLAGLVVLTTLGLYGFGAIGIAFAIGYIWLNKVSADPNIVGRAFLICSKVLYNKGIHTPFIKYYGIAISITHLVVTALLVGVLGNSAHAGTTNIIGTTAAWLLHPILFFKDLNRARVEAGMSPYKSRLSILTGTENKKAA